ncbi:MAG: SMC family ATPase [Fervidicoccaceae archaeon]
MIVERIRLEGFRSYYEASEIELGEGLTVIIGENGAGKSSIVEALYFALLGELLRGKIEEVLNNRGRPLEVRVRLRGDRGIVEIARGRGRRPQHSFDELKVDGKLVARGARETTSFLAERVLALGPEGASALERVLRTCVVSQGGLAEIISMLSRPGARLQDWVNEQLGLKDYELAYERLGELSLEAPKLKSSALSVALGSPSYRVTEEGLRSLRTDLERGERILREREKRRGELEKRRGEIEEGARRLRRELEEVERRREELRRELEEVEERGRRARELEASIATLEREVSAEREALARAEERLRALGAPLVGEAELERIEALAKVSAELERLGALSRALSPAFEEAIELRSLVEILESEGLAVGEDFSALSKSVERALRELEFSRSEAERLSRELDRVRRELEELARRAAEAAKKMGATADAGPPPTDLEAYGELADFLERRAEEIVERLVSEVSSLESKRVSAARGVCVVCGGLLTEERRRRMLEEASSRLAPRERELAEARSSLGELREILRELRSRLAEASDLSRRLEEAARRASEASKMGGEEVLRRRLEVLERVGELARSLLTDLRRCEALGLARAPEVGEVGELVARAREVAAWAEGLSGELAELSEELAGERSRLLELMPPELRPEVEKKSARELEELARALRERLRRHSEIASEMESRRRRLERLESELSSLRSQLESLKYDEVRHRELRRELDALSSRAGELAGSIASLESELRRCEDELRSLEADLSASREDLESLARLGGRLEALLRLRGLFHREGLPAKIRRYALKRVEVEMNRLLQLFDLEYREVEIGEDLSLRFLGPRGSASFSQLSGGESVAAAISFLLALRRTVEELLIGKSVLGFMVLDEPTIHLDDERRTALARIFSEFQGGRVIPQLIVVTHEDDMKEVGDSVVLVERVGGASRARRLEAEVS